MYFKYNAPKLIKLFIAIFIFVIIILLASKFFTPSSVSIPDTTTDINQKISDIKENQSEERIIVAAGDIACGNRFKQKDQCQQEATANLISQINPDMVLIPGDIQYDGASIEVYQKYYHPTWGKFKSITRPTLGNHEFENNLAEGYFSYFGSLGGEHGKGYYSFDIDNWHIIALNSNCGYSGGCGVNSVQYKWLEEDLINNSQTCTLAYWHHPLFSSGPHGENLFVKDFWHLLYKYQVEIVINGHDHLYERFSPLNPDGKLDWESGIRQFIVGTGGRNLYQFKTRLSASESQYNQNFGVLKLVLQEDGYEWEFLTIEKDSRDKGNALCF